ncbi:snRNA-activating protein of 50kDa MW C terminal-domain-containing protein [Haematococcus lacustris]
MATATCGQLSARLSNHPIYLFCHLGCCEHLVQVRDVRRMHPDDPRRRSAYPLQLLPLRVSSAARTPRRCDVCEGNLADTVAYDDPLAPANPAFYCQRCVRQLHGTKPRPAGMSMFPYAAQATVAEPPSGDEHATGLPSSP